MPALRDPVLAAGSLGAGPQPQLHAGELVMRPWETADAELLARAYADPDIRRWHLRSMDAREARDWVRERHREWRAESRADWAVTSSSGEVLGRVALHGINLARGSAEAGYWVLPEARGHGLAARALEAVSGWAFGQVGMRRLELEHSTENPVSCRVALRAGFAAEGTRRGSLLHEDGWHDMHLHARLACDPPRGA